MLTKLKICSPYAVEQAPSSRKVPLPILMKMLWLYPHDTPLPSLERRALTSDHISEATISKKRSRAHHGAVAATLRFIWVLVSRREMLKRKRHDNRRASEEDSPYSENSNTDDLTAFNAEWRKQDCREPSVGHCRVFCIQKDVGTDKRGGGTHAGVVLISRIFRTNMARRTSQAAQLVLRSTHLSRHVVQI
jgi:hypothetical protein